MIIASGGISWTRVRVPRILSRIALALYVLNGATNAVALLFGTSGALGIEGAVALTLGLSLAIWPLFIVSYILSLTQTWSPGTVEVEGDVLVVGKRRIAFGAIASALVVDRPVANAHVTTVEIELASGDRVAVRTPDEATARVLVERLGFGPHGRRARFTLATPTRRLLHPVLGVIASVVSTVLVMFESAGSYAVDVRTDALRFAVSILAPLFTTAIYFGLKTLVRPSSVTVADDAIVIERVRRRVLPRRAVAAVSRVRGAPLFIGLRDGTRAVVTGIGLDWPRLEAVGRLIEARHGPSAAAEKLAVFDRSGSSLAEWREHIRVAMDRAGYRSVAASVDDAAEIVRSPHATPEQRVGAAIALRVAGEPQRVRVAAEAVADPDVRRALEAIARDDEPDAEKALRRLSR